MRVVVGRTDVVVGSRVLEVGMLDVGCIVGDMEAGDQLGYIVVVVEVGFEAELEDMVDIGAVVAGLDLPAVLVEGSCYSNLVLPSLWCKVSILLFVCSSVQKK